MPATDTEALGLIDEVLDSYCRANPVWATYAGVRDFDGALPDLRAEARQEWLEARKSPPGDKQVYVVVSPIAERQIRGAVEDWV